MGKYSQHDLLAEEFERVKSPPGSFLERLENVFFSVVCSTVPLELKIPSFTFLRAEVLCGDISELTDTNFTVCSLLELLYEDFLNHIQRSNDLYRIYRTLQVSFPDSKIHHYKSITRMSSEGESTNSFQILMKRKKVLRCEVFLNDLNSIVPDHEFTVEKILQMLLVDFIKNYTSGNYPKLVGDLIERLEKKGSSE